MRRTKLVMSALAFAAVVSGPALLAQEPVVGRADESMFTDTDPVLHRNKQTTLHIMRELLQCGQWDRAGEWLTDAYHQHNPNAQSGLKGVVDFFTKVVNQPRVDACDKLTTEITAVIAEDDLVTVLWPRRIVTAAATDPMTAIQNAAHARRRPVIRPRLASANT